MGEETERYSVIITPAAANMLQQHALFLAQVSPAAAEALIQEFEKIAASLSFMPQRYALLTDTNITPGKYRRVGLGKWLLLIYQIKGSYVYIDSVLDCRQDYQWLLP